MAVEEQLIIITKKETEPREISTEIFTITKSGSVTVTRSNKEKSDDDVYAVNDTAFGEITATLNGNISLTDKSKGEHMTSYGLGFVSENTKVAIKTESAAKISVTRDTDTTGPSTAYGIYTGKSTSLSFDGDRFLDAITVNATNSNKNDGGIMTAFAVFSDASVIFDSELAAAVKVTAAAKSNTANAIGIKADTATFKDITKDISVAATGKASLSSYSSTVAATAIKVSGTLTIDDLAGNITATATANATTSTEDYSTSNSEAFGLYTYYVYITGDVTKNITATATANGVTRNGEYGKYTVSGTATAIGIETTYCVYIKGNLAGTVKVTAKSMGYCIDSGESATAIGIEGKNYVNISGDITKDISATASSMDGETYGTTYASGIRSDGTVSIYGKLAGSIKATATAKKGCATAKGITGTYVRIQEGITKDISATATGGPSEDSTIMAAAVYASDGIDIGKYDTNPENNIEADLAGNITATATANAVANASAYGLNGESSYLSVNGDITKTISATATANSVTVKGDGTYTAGGSATATGIKSNSGCSRIYGKLAGAIKATATAKANGSEAFGINCAAISIYDSITKDISVTAAGVASNENETSTAAAAIKVSGALDTADLAGNITVSASGKSYLNQSKTFAYDCDTEAFGLEASSISINGDITKNITVTASSNSVTTVDEGGVRKAVGGYATASGLELDKTDGTNVMQITGKLAGKITVKATAAANEAKASGVKSSAILNIGDGVSGEISATASGDTAIARGIFSGGNMTIGTEDKTEIAIKSNITAKATATSVEEDNSTEAYGLYAAGLNIYGDIKGKITASASGKAGTVTAYGIKSNSSLTMDENLGSISATATNKASSSDDSASALAFGIYSAGEQLTVESNLGTINVTATGNGYGNDKVYGVSTNGSISYTGAIFNAKITATCKKGEAYGLNIGSIVENGTAAGTAKLNISATGYEWAIALQLNDKTALTLKDSTITAKYVSKWGSAGAVCGERNTDQDIILTGKTTLTGNVDLGTRDDGTEEKDSLTIHSGSKIKGNVYGVENACLVLDDAKTASSALWEGFYFGANDIKLDFDSDMLEGLNGKKKTFMLLNDKDGEMAIESVTLQIDGKGETKTLEMGATENLGGYNFVLHKDGGNKKLYITTVAIIA